MNLGGSNLILILTAFIIILDQLTKYGAIKFLKGQKPIVIVKNFIELTYVENRGAAFGILQQKRMLFVVITLLVVVLITFYLVKNYNSLTKVTHIGIALLIGGALGNLIDRIRFGYVVDFISVRLINSYDFPVFNVADISIVLSTILIIYIVLFDKHEIV